MNIAIIPARGGSKRIKLKNIKKFQGKPIIYYPLKTALKSKLFNKIIVSSDSEKILDYVKKKFPKIQIHKRSKKYSNDKVKTITTIRNIVRKKNFYKYKFICCIYPATPLLKKTTLKKTLSICKKNKKFVFPVIQNNQKHKILKLNFKDAGQFYWGTRNNWLHKKSLISYESIIYKLKQNEAVDINTMRDWREALKLFKRK